MSFLVLLSWDMLNAKVKSVVATLGSRLCYGPTALHLPPERRRATTHPDHRAADPASFQHAHPTLVSSVSKCCGVCAHDLVRSHGSDVHHLSRHGWSSLATDSIFPYSPVLRDCKYSYEKSLLCPPSHCEGPPDIQDHIFQLLRLPFTLSS